MATSVYKSPAGFAAVMNWYDQALGELGVSCESRTVNTHYGHTHMLVTGDEAAPPLLLIHGLGGCAPLWKWQLPVLSQRHRVYALDTIGQPGKSAPNTYSFFSDAYSRWLVEVIDALHLEQVNVIGISIGGLLAIQLALAAAERITRLILLSPIGLARLNPSFLRQGAPMVLNLSRSSDDKGRELLRLFLAPSGSGLTLNPEIEEAMMLVIQHVNVAGYTMGDQPFLMGLPLAFRDMIRFLFPVSPARLRRLSMPTYVLMAQHETLCRPEAALARARQHLPDLRASHLVAGVGHMMLADRPEHVNAFLMDFLDDVV